MRQRNIDNVEQSFQNLAPWVTRFIIDGRNYGGDFDALNDKRVIQFFECFPNAKNVLELGSLECGHTIAIARNKNIQKIIGIEGMIENFKKADYIKRLFKCDKIELIHANLENFDSGRLGNFDAVFCSGILYHLSKPWNLIQQISKVSDNLFIWTHYAKDEQVNLKIDGYEGMTYTEPLGTPQMNAGFSFKSFWFTLPSLYEALNNYGFVNIKTIEVNIEHPNGNCVTICAKKV